MGDKEAQSEEIQSIEAIFGDLVHLESTARINVQFEHDIQLTIDLPPDYPSWFVLSLLSVDELKSTWRGGGGLRGDRG